MCRQAAGPLPACRAHGAGLRFVRLRGALCQAHRPCCSTPMSSGYGGSGKVFDWSQIPPSVPLPVVLSGGLNPANVTDGVLSVRPWAVDVSSGVEVSKGVKSGPLMRRFCKAVREARCPRSPQCDESEGHACLNTTNPMPAGISGPTVRRHLCRRNPHPRAARTGSRLRQVPRRPRIRGRVPARAEALCRPAQPGLPRRAAEPRDRRRADSPQARRPQPHRRAQGQQHHRAGPAGAAHGQAARDRRNRRRPARRGHGHHLRALRHGVRGLHGQRRRQTPEPQRLPHAPAGRQGGAGGKRQQDAEGRAE
jgi:hypothetical protein